MSVTKRKPRRYVQVGELFGRLTVLGLDTERTCYGKRFFRCQCSCGNTLTVYAGSLTSDNTTSCGCVRLERVKAALSRRSTHGQSLGCRKSKLYDAYINMVRRCYDPDCQMYHRYGGRGITVCQRWREDRAAFFADMGEPPPGSSIDRLKNDLGYWCGKAECPECGPAGREPNCRWATNIEQGANKSTNVLMTHAGKTLTMAEWSRITGISYRDIRNRKMVLGWSDERTLTEPVRQLTPRKS